MAFVQARTETVDLDVHDILHLFTRNLMENDHFIDAVDKFRAEALFTQSLPHRALYLILIHAIILMQPEIANVAGHDNHRIFEIDGSPLPIRQATIIEQLQQDVEDLGRGLLDLIQQDHAVGMPPHGFGQLSAFIVANVTRRCANEARDAVFLHVLGHVDAHHRLLVVEQELRQRACQLGLTNSCRA